MIFLAVAALLLGQSEPQGSADDFLQYRLAKSFGSPSGATVSDLAMGLASARFGTRYVAMLLKLQLSYDTGRGFEDAHQLILKQSPHGGPKGAAEHLSALAESLKAAVRCKECKDGKVACSKCLGKGRVDLQCTVCNGAGRVRPSGAIGNTDVTVKCRNCEGIGLFRNVTCPSCGRSGRVACSTCKGRPWPEARCDNPVCKDGRALCPTCHGTGHEVFPCPDCQNGRRRAPGAAGSADVSMKCRTCEVDGKQGNGTLKQDCRTCKKVGRVTCEQCGGLLGRKKAASVGGISDVYATERCGDCDGTGWPEAGKAAACGTCLGLGVRVKPASDASKVLEKKP